MSPRGRSPMRRALVVLASLAPLVCTSLVRGQPGSVDGSFNPGLGISGPDAYVHVRCLAVGPDGRVLFGGRFQSYDLFPQLNLGRTTAGGVRDVFNPDVDFIVECITLQ